MITIVMPELLEREVRTLAERQAVHIVVYGGDMADLVTELHTENKQLIAERDTPKPIPMLMWCPLCHTKHVDEGEWATRLHRRHQCQACGAEWRPANVNTVGVLALPDLEGINHQ